MPAEALIHGRYEVQHELDRDALVVRDLERPEQPLRVLRFPRVEDDEGGRAVEHELRLLTRVEHPNLARVLDVGRGHDGRLYFLQERVEGENFFSWAVGRDAAQLVGVFAQLLAVMGSFHARGLVVGGKRPLRLLVEAGETPAPRLRVVDPGGLAHEFARTEHAAPHARTLAPERRAGAAVDRRANLYEAGVILYELLAGSSPADLPLPGGSSAGAGSGSFPPLADLAPSLPLPVAAYVMVLLRPVPEDRPRSTAEALDALRAVTDLELAVGTSAEGALPPPFLGRERELLEGLTWLRPLNRPSRRRRTPGGPVDPEESLLVVHGQQGSGRARCLDALAVRMEAEGVRVISAACGDRGRGVAGALASVLRQLFSDPSSLEEASATSRWALSELLPFAEGAAPASRPPELEEPELERLRLLDALVEPLLAQARRRPLLLVLRHLEAAAALERDLVVHLARRTFVASAWARRRGEEAPRLRVLASACVPERDDRRVQELLALPFAKGIALAPLSQRDVIQLTQERLGVEVEAIPLDLRESLAGAARGSPGRALQLIEDHQSDADLALGAATSLVDERFARARDVEVTVLQALAVLGRSATAGLLAEASDDEEESVEVAVAALLAAGALEPSEGWRYRIASPALVELVRRVTPRSRQRELACALATARRVQLGEPTGWAPEARLELARLAAWGDEEGVADAAILEEHGPGAAAHLEALGAWELAAELYDALARLERGRTWRRRQAKALFRAGRQTEASAICREFLATREEGPAAARADVWATLVGACWAAGRDAEAVDALAEAREDMAAGARQGEVALGLARLLSIGGAMHLEMGEAQEANSLCEEALDLLKREGVAGPEAIRLRVRVLIQLGQLATQGEDTQEAELLLKASLALQERQGFAQEAARTLQLLGNVALGRGEYEGAEEHWRRSLQLWGGLEDRAGQAHVRSSLAMAAARRGQLAAARQELERSLEIREEAGDRPGTAACLHNLGYVYACAGGLPEAAEAYRRCLALRTALGDRYYEASAANNLGWVLVELGAVREARALLEQAYATRLELGDRRGEAQTLANLAELDLRCGELGRALTQAAQAQRIRDELGSREESIDSYRRGARIQLALGQPERARGAAEAAVRGSRERGLSLHEGPSRLLLGEVLARAGQRAEARRELERARRCAEQVGDRLTARAATIELAGLQLAMGDPDLARARLDSRSVPRPGRLDPLLGVTPPDRQGQLRVRERLLRALIELAREGGSVSTAARCAEEALGEARRAGLRDLEWRATYARAAVAELRDRPEQALSLTLEAQEVVEELVATVPAEQQETYLAADPVRAAALRGDSPVAALGARAGGHESDSGSLQELRAMLGRPATPTIEPPRRPTPAATPRPAPAAPQRDEPSGVVARDDFAAVVRLNRSIVDEPDVQRAYQQLVAAAAQLCRAERAYLAVFGDSPDQLTILATHALDDLNAPRQRFARRCGFKAADAGQLVLSADVKVDAELKRRTLLLGLGLRSILAAPVQTPDQQRGVLFVDHPFQTGHFRSREVELLEVLADQCAMAVARAALEGALHQRRGVSPGVPQQQLLRAKAAVERPALLRAVVRFGSGASGLVGRSPSIAAAVRALEQFADTDVSLLIEGPPGVGKGVIARAAHDAGRRQGPLVAVDLRELPEGAFESELFGHEAGAFAGAEQGRLGLIRSAQGGTLLLERLDEAPAALQGKLVRALEQRSVRPVGADAPIPFDARVVATARDVAGAVQRGELREDLVTLVGEARLALPSLDERPEDKGPLLDAIVASWEGDPPQVPGPVRAALVERAYPGNARELHAILRAAAARARGRPLQLADLPRERPRRVQGLGVAVQEFEREYVQRALRAHEGDLTAAAKELGITRRALQRKLEQLGPST
jgi:two-component system response regulator HydG